MKTLVLTDEQFYYLRYYVCRQLNQRDEKGGLIKVPELGGVLEAMERAIDAEAEEEAK